MGTDGNLAALRKYEREQEATENNIEYVVGAMQEDSKSLQNAMEIIVEDIEAFVLRTKGELDERGLSDSNEMVLDIVKSAVGDETELEMIVTYVLENR